ncbi:MAG TPA: BlaI/MecI/CopY family transcriptional regulator [Longimicrobium sp.]|jgi:predicted transcriptional regulator
MIRLPPTPAELRLLRTLWRVGPSTVREVNERLHGPEAVGYTTTLRILQNMHAKGLVERERVKRQHVYRASMGESETENGFVGALIDRVFGGSGARLAMRALAAKPASPEELAELRAMIARIERGDSGDDAS